MTYHPLYVTTPTARCVPTWTKLAKPSAVLTTTPMLSHNVPPACSTTNLLDNMEQVWATICWSNKTVPSLTFYEHFRHIKHATDTANAP